MPISLQNPKKQKTEVPVFVSQIPKDNHSPGCTVSFEESCPDTVWVESSPVVGWCYVSLPKAKDQKFWFSLLVHRMKHEDIKSLKRQLKSFSLCEKKSGWPKTTKFLYKTESELNYGWERGGLGPPFNVTCFFPMSRGTTLLLVHEGLYEKGKSLP